MSSQKQIFTLRRVNENDRDDLLRWRNDENTRKNSHQTEIVSETDHDRWFMASLRNENRVMFMADCETGKCGTLRFDLDDRESRLWRISIVVNPAFRGKGLGQALLERGCAEFEALGIVQGFVAEVREDNNASRRIFERCGFRTVSLTGGFFELRREASPMHAEGGNCK